MDGLKLLGCEQIKVPERRRFDPDEPRMFIIYLIRDKKMFIY
jgi:hypothetical protein